MMQQKLQKWAKEQKREHDIFDIVLFGSYAKGKINPSDLDIILIFKTFNLKERLILIQEMKQKLLTLSNNLKIDLKSILLQELFDPAFFGRTGVIWEGVSLYTGKPFAEKMGFFPQSLFIYNLQDKTHTEKVRINYILKGRKGIGIIEKLQGKHPAPGVVEIPSHHALEFEEVLKKQNIHFVRKNILIQE